MENSSSKLSPPSTYERKTDCFVLYNPTTKQAQKFATKNTYELKTVKHGKFGARCRTMNSVQVILHTATVTWVTGCSCQVLSLAPGKRNSGLFLVFLSKQSGSLKKWKVSKNGKANFQCVSLLGRSQETALQSGSFYTSSERSSRHKLSRVLT